MALGQDGLWFIGSRGSCNAVVQLTELAAEMRRRQHPMDSSLLLALQVFRNCPGALPDETGRERLLTSSLPTFWGANRKGVQLR